MLKDEFFFLKTCIVCNKEKQLYKFHKKSNSTDGHQPKCKDCEKDYYVENRDELLARSRIYSQSAKGKKTIKRAGDIRRKRHPLRISAYKKVDWAVKMGTLIKQPCEKCGSPSDIQAHHEDYNKPLDVVWLCRDCHFKLHRREICL